MSTTPGNVRLLRCAPYFPVPDVQKAARYYEITFGFTTNYAAGDPPQFAIVSRDGLDLMLRRVPETSRIVPNEAQGGTWDAFFWVSDADALCAELKARSAEIVYGPIVQEYQMKEFAVRDLNGYVLGFGQDWHE